ncbi:hypothetical protein RclHR1_07270004 [Rhizophagus clarus]|nr:hypothetical protein RclHR1_07270004 [Rhizophagus clarus]
MDNLTLLEASKQRGNKFESDINDSLSNSIDCRNKSYKDVLKNAQVGQTFSQMKFNVPENFYDSVNIKNIIELKSFIPDFIEVIEEGGKKKLMVWDAKSSKSARISHQFQVASYVYLLDFVIQEFPDLTISHTIGIQLPNQPLQTFNIDLLLQRIEKFFREDLPRIITKEPSWNYNSRCRTCDFVNDCRNDCKNGAEGSISMIPYLSSENAESLKTFMSSRKDIVDIEDMVNFINKSKDIKESDNSTIKQIKRIVKYDKKSKTSPYLKAKRTKQAQFIGLPVANFPQETDHNLLITMSLDPYLSRPFGWGICLHTGDGKILESFKRAGAILKNEFQEKYISLMDEFVTTLAKCFEYLSQVKSHACIFVYSEREKTTIQEALLEIITMDDNTISYSLQHNAKRCLFNLFEEASLMSVTGSKDGDIMEIPDSKNEWREFPRLIILEQAIKKNIAIYEPGFYRLVDIWQQLVKPTLSNDQELLNSLEQHMSIDLDYIYNSWVSENSSKQIIQDIHLLRIMFGSAVIRAYYKLLKKSIVNIDSILIFNPPIFTFTEIKAFRNHYLGKLYFFKQFEAIIDCTKTRSTRIKDFTQDESMRGIQLKFKTESKNKILKFTVINNNKEGSLSEHNSFKRYILVEDNPAGILNAIKYSDMQFRKERNNMESAKGSNSLAIVCIHEVDNETIYLKGYTKNLRIKENEKYRLYDRYLDSNLDKVLTVLAEIDERSDDNQLMVTDLLKDPNAWGSSSASNEEQYKIKNATLSLESLHMSPSQKIISKELLKKSLQVVWGPPGSGKTHFLALFTTWYLNAFISKLTGANKKCVIGVTAFTKDAISNLLERISHERKDRQFDILNMVKNCEKNGISKTIKENGRSIVIGGTVWDWYKIRNIVKCDIMMIDEGSQLLVSDAIIAIECLNLKTGKLIVAGDHMQLGPIIKNPNSYPTFPCDHPLLFGSIQQCLMRRNNGSIIHDNSRNHDFGPHIKQLTENWRMNKEVNELFQNIYGKNYISKNPNLKLALDDEKLSHMRQKIEADVVEKIATSFFESLKVGKEQKLFIVTPYNRQLHEINSRLKCLKIKNLQINTVNKIQGQEADIVIACFGFFTLKDPMFMFNMNRWNTALSRAKSKLIIITTDKMLVPDDIEIFINKKLSGGLEFLHMVKNLVQSRGNQNSNIKGKRPRVDYDDDIVEWIIDGREKRLKK